MPSESEKPAPMRPRPKYQVFISSTYTDLHEERTAVTWEVLKARHIPAGMENFTATDDRGWRTIQRTIDLSDYYVLLTAGMYGSIDPSTGTSWTEREYRYARGKGMRVLAFIRNEAHVTAVKMEKDPAKHAKLEALKQELRENHLCEMWNTPDDLKARVMQALQNQIAEDEDGGSPQPGWYRGDEIGTSPAVLEEFARLSAENAEIKAQLQKLQGDSSERLLLAARDGAAPLDRIVSATRVRVTAPPDDMFSNALGKPSAKTAEAYARSRSLTVWWKFKIQNTGSRPARNVVADFTATNVRETYVHDFGQFSPFGAAPRVRAFYVDPAEHVYVESYSAKSGTAAIRQRIKQVAAGGDELLIAMGFEAEATYTSDESIPIVLNYSLRSEDGVTTSGVVTATVEIRGIVELSIKEAMAENDE